MLVYGKNNKIAHAQCSLWLTGFSVIKTLDNLFFFGIPYLKQKMFMIYHVTFPKDWLLGGKKKDYEVYVNQTFSLTGQELDCISKF